MQEAELGVTHGSARGWSLREIKQGAVHGCGSGECLKEECSACLSEAC
jgi:hypothetical protein